jgi:hypothetical protein
LPFDAALGVEDRELSLARNAVGGGDDALFGGQRDDAST